jgi:hypothetical protein
MCVAELFPFDEEYARSLLKPLPGAIDVRFVSIATPMDMKTATGPNAHSFTPIWRRNRTQEQSVEIRACLQLPLTETAQRPLNSPNNGWSFLPGTFKSPVDIMARENWTFDMNSID